MVVFGKDKILSIPRFPDELIRHKILDVIGDMYLLGPIHAHIICMKSGHAFNDNVSRQIDEYRRLHEYHPRHTPIPGKEKKEVRSKDMITLDIQEIQKILPHRYPMLLVDRIIELEPMKRAVGIKNITMNEPQFIGHFPGNPIMPGVLLIEAMAQVGGVTLLYPEENRARSPSSGKSTKCVSAVPSNRETSWSPRPSSPRSKATWVWPTVKVRWTASRPAKEISSLHWQKINNKGGVKQ